MRTRRKFEKVKFDCTKCNNYSTGWTEDDSAGSHKRWELIITHWDKEHPHERGFMTRWIENRTRLVMAFMGIEEVDV